MFPFVSPALSIAASVAASAASTAASAARTCLGRRAPTPLIQPEPDRLVPRFPGIEQALLDLASRMPPEGGIIITDHAERVPAISFNFVRAIGLESAAKVLIMVAATTEAERAEVERLKATGQLRPIFRDPAMPPYRQPKPVPPPESVEDLIAAQARDIRRRLKLEKKAARHARRCGHYEELIAILKGLGPRSCTILVQSDAYGRHVGRMIERVCSHLGTGRFCYFIQTCAPWEDEAAVLERLPDYAQNLPIVRTPGLALARNRTAARAARSTLEGRVIAWPAAATPDRTLLDRVATLEGQLERLIGLVERVVSSQVEMHHQTIRL